MPTPSQTQGNVEEIRLQVTTLAPAKSGLTGTIQQLTQVKQLLDTINNSVLSMYRGATVPAQFRKSLDAWQKDFATSFQKTAKVSMGQIGDMLKLDKSELAGLEDFAKRYAQAFKGIGGTPAAVGASKAAFRKQIESEKLALKNATIVAHEYARERVRAIEQENAARQKLVRDVFTPAVPAGGAGAGAGSGKAAAKGTVDLVVPVSQIRATVGPGVIEVVIPAGQVVGAAVAGAPVAGAPAGGKQAGTKRTKGTKTAVPVGGGQQTLALTVVPHGGSAARSVPLDVEILSGGLRTQAARVRGLIGPGTVVIDVPPTTPSTAAPSKPAAPILPPPVRPPPASPPPPSVGGGTGGGGAESFAAPGSKLIGTKVTELSKKKGKIETKKWEEDVGAYFEETFDAAGNWIRQQRTTDLTAKDKSRLLTRISDIKAEAVRIGTDVTQPMQTRIAAYQKAIDDLLALPSRMTGLKQDVADQLRGRLLTDVGRFRSQAGRMTEQVSREDAARALAQTRAQTAMEALRTAPAEGWTVQQQAPTRIGKGGVSQAWVLGREDATHRYARTVSLQYSAKEWADAVTSGRGIESLKAVDGAVSQVEKSMQKLGSTTNAAARGFVTNTKHVTAWATSVAVLYGTMGLIQRTMQNLIETTHQTARLDQVFSGIGGSAIQLRDQVLALAAANGRSSEEAMEAAVQWSRLGLTKTQVTDAVRTSLVAANVAELSTADATKHLQAVYMGYNLSVRDLTRVLGQMNAISNTFNVTNADLFMGLSRTAAVAKAAGMPLAELMATLGVTVGKTAQSGQNIGNAFKSLTVALNKPDIQKFLMEQYQLPIRSGDTGDIEDLATVLQRLYLAYTQVQKAEQLYMLTRIAGKTQASRVAAMLDSYIQQQVLAVNAQLNLNSAEEENAKILNTLRAQLAGVVTEYDRFISKQAIGGPLGRMLSDATGGGWNLGPEGAMKGGLKALRGVMALMNTELGSAVTTGMLALVTAVGVKMALFASSAAKAAVATGTLQKNAGWLTQTFKQLGDLWALQLLPTLNKLPTAGAVLAGWGGRGAGALGWVRQQRAYSARRRALLAEGALYAGPDPYARAGQTAHITGSGAFGFTTGQERREAYRNRRAEWQRLMSAHPSGAYMLGAAVGRSAGAVTGIASRVLGSFLSLTPYVAVAAAGVWAFNKAVEAAGLTSEKSAREIEKINQRRQQHEAAADAATTAMRLYDTLIQQANSPGIKPAQQKQLMELLPQLGGDTAWSGLLGVDKKELENAFKQGGEAVQALFQKKMSDATQVGFMERQAAWQERQNELQSMLNEEKRLMRSPFGKNRLPDIRKKIEGLRAQQAQYIVDESSGEAYEKLFTSTMRGRAHEARQQHLLGATQQFFAGMPGETNTVRLVNEMRGLDTQRRMIQSRLGELNYSDKAQAKDDEARKTQLESANKELDAARAEYTKQQSMARGASYTPGQAAVPPGSPQLAAAEQAVKDAEAKVRQIEAMAGRGGGELARRQGERNLLNKSLEQVATEYAKREAMVKAVRIQDTAQEARMRGSDRAALFGVGENQTVALLDKRSRLEQAIAQNRTQIAAASGNDLERQRLIVETLELNNQLTQTKAALRREDLAIAKAEVELQIRQKREAERGILSSGPEDMLRRVAAFRMTRNAQTGEQKSMMGLGQFLTLDPEMRELAGQWDSRLTPEGRELAQRRASLAGARGTLGNAATDAKAAAGIQDALLKQLSTEWMSALAGAMPIGALDGFEKQLNIARDAVQAFANVLNTASGNQPPTSGPPSNPNAGGHAPGTGTPPAGGRSGQFEFEIAGKPGKAGMAPGWMMTIN